MQWVPGGGSRNRERPIKTWGKTFKEDLAGMEFNYIDAKTIANDEILVFRKEHEELI